MKIEELPNIIPIFPLSNFIMFPGTSVPLNIFEPRYLQMVNDSMKNDRIIGMVQPRKTGVLKSLIYMTLDVLEKLLVLMKQMMEEF